MKPAIEASTGAPQSGTYIPASTPRDAPERLRRLQAFAWLLDSAIPLPGGLRIGLDPLIGLLPGLGDVIGALLSAYIIGEAHALGASRSLVVRMVGNVLLETLIGSIPLLGDLFDAGFKTNLRNVALLERHQFNPVRGRRQDRLFIAGLLLLAVLVIVALVAIPTLLVVLVAKHV